MVRNTWAVIATFEDGCEYGFEYLGTFLGTIKDIALSIDVNRYVRDGNIEDMHLHFYDVSKSEIHGEKKTDKVVVYQINGENAEDDDEFVTSIKKDGSATFNKKSRVLSSEPIENQVIHLLKNLPARDKQVLQTALEQGLDINELLTKKG